MSGHDTAPRLVVLPGGRAVGYRRFGAGPAVALLHASPRSAAAVLPLGLTLAARHTVFAFDTPGFGWSDPLALPRPDAEDFGDALVEAFDALGIAQAAVYGSHTGAAIAVAAAIRHPARVTALALDGYAIFTPAAQAESLASYLAPIRPAWDGTHLAFLWSRVKDQFTVFPWYLRAEAARIGRPLAPLSLIQAVVVDFLAAGDHYRAGYAAAFRYAGNAALQALIVPTTVLARSDDLLFGHIDALHDLPDCVTSQKLGEDLGAWAEAVQQALSRGGVPAAVRAPAADARVVRVAGGTIGLVRHDSGTGVPRGGTGVPLLLLPGIPGSARGEAALARALSGGRPVWAVDLPGFGAASLPGAGSVDDIAEAVAAALQASGIAAWDVVAMGESDAIGAALCRRHPGRLVLVDPVPQAARAGMAAHMVDVTPQPGGGHLLAAWHMLRDRTLWRPWFEADPAHAVANGTDPDVARLHAIMTDWMRGGTEGARTLALAMAASAPDASVPVVRGPEDRHLRAAAILAALA